MAWFRHDGGMSNADKHHVVRDRFRQRQQHMIPVVENKFFKSLQHEFAGFIDAASMGEHSGDRLWIRHRKCGKSECTKVR